MELSSLIDVNKPVHTVMSPYMSKAAEEVFPRGGNQKRKFDAVVKPTYTEEKQLFQEATTYVPKPKKKRSKDKGTDIWDVDDDTVVQTWKIEPLYKKTLTTDILTLGCIKGIKEFEVHVSLPGGIRGKVPITSISEHYSALLQRVAYQGDKEVPDDFGSLSELFYIGQPVCCKVESLDSGKSGCLLSINPSATNQRLRPSTIRAGMIVPCAVVSKEDHGFILDLGIKGVNVFLRKKEAKAYAEKFFQDSELKVGMIISCLVKEEPDETSRNLKISVNPNEVYKAKLDDDSGVNIGNILPGMIVNATLKKNLEKGYVVQLFTQAALIPYNHIKIPVPFKEGQQVTARVLHVNPEDKSVSLTTLPHLMNPLSNPVTLLNGLKLSQVIEDAVVIHQVPPRNLYFTLSGNVKALCLEVNLAKNESTKEKYKLDSSHRCKIVHFNYLEGLAIITLDEKKIKEKIHSFDDIEVGMKLKGTVKRVIEGEGVVLNLTSSLHGLVPLLHLADTISKHTQKRFKEGAQVNCRVLSINHEKRQMLLTCKKSLVSSKAEPITSYHQLSAGMLVEGVIVNIQNKGILLKFYNNIQGFVPRHQWSTEEIDYPEQVFYLGQIVKAQVLTSVPDQEKLFLSFRISNELDFQTKQPVEMPKDLDIGEVTDCEILNAQKTGFTVKLGTSGCSAFLPREHLSDSLTLTEMLWQMYKPGYTIPAVLFMGSAKHQLMVSMKRSYIQAAEEGMLVTQFENLKKGLVVPAVVKKICDFGIFVDIFPGLQGLIHNENVVYHKLLSLEAVFTVGQTVMVSVMRHETEDRVSVSTRPEHGCDTMTGNGLELLKNAIRTENHVRELILSEKCKQGRLKKLASLKMSDIINVTVTDVGDQQIVCKSKNGIQAVVNFEHFIGVKCETGDVLEALVLYVDVVKQCVEVSLLKYLITSVKELCDNKYDQAYPEECMKCQVQLVKEDFILASLEGSCTGRFAYIPAKRHINEIITKPCFEVGQQNMVVIKGLVGDSILATLQMFETNEKKRKYEDKRSKTKRRSSARLKFGDFIEERVKTSNKKFHMFIGASGPSYAVHISEIEDHMEENRCPYNNFETGVMVKARVIGFRKHCSYSKQETQKKLKKKIPILSLKKSIMALSVKELEQHVKKDKYEVGQAVTGFFNTYANNCLHFILSETVRAKVYSLKSQKEIHSYFKSGWAYNGTITGKISENLVEMNMDFLEPFSVQEGGLVTGTVKMVSPHQGLVLELPEGYRGTVALTDLSDIYKDKPHQYFHKDQILTCFVIKCDLEKKEAVLSLRKTRLKGKLQAGATPELPAAKDLKKGHLYKGFIVNCDKNGVFVRLSHEVVGRVLYEHASNYVIKQPREVFYKGRVVMVKVLSVIKQANQVELSLLEEDTGVELEIPKAYLKCLRHSLTKKKETVGLTKRKQEDDRMSDTKMKKRKLESDSGVESDDDDGIKFMTVSALRQAPRLNVSGGFTWDDKFQPPPDNTEYSDSEESETDTTQTLPKMPKKTKTEKRLDEEKELFMAEKRLLRDDNIPSSAEEFDRLVLQSPDSSMVWLRYMAHFLESMETEKARDVAERALKTISFREEQEKLNIWVAYLNLENMYGNKDSLNKVFTRALQHNDPIKVYHQLINIYESCSKMDEAEQLHDILVRRYSQNKEMWNNFGTFLFRNNKIETARKLLQRSFRSLEMRHHVDVIGKFAQLEFKFGEAERGKTMYEKVLTSYPKRTDLWSVYIDMLTKRDDIETARQVLERVIHLKLPAKKIKFFFKKYLDFEEKFGSHETVAGVKEKALEYVESKTNTDS